MMKFAGLFREIRQLYLTYFIIIQRDLNRRECLPKTIIIRNYIGVADTYTKLRLKVMKLQILRHLS